jgi:hypothetical protein
MKIIELIIDEKDEKSGILAISIVETPAIMENFVALNKHEILLKEVDAEKRILMGPALIPNKQIFRKNEKGDEDYYIYFSEHTVRKASELFFQKSNHQNATLEHRSKISGMTIVESWIVENPELDKSAIYNLNVPKGTWMVSMKVDDDEMLEKAKSGEVKGFSIEGYFADKYEMSIETNKTDLKIEELKQLLS